MRIHELLRKHSAGELKHGALPGGPAGGSVGQERPGIAQAIEQNILTVVQLRRQAELRKTRQDHIADHITRFSGSMPFLYIHAVWFGLWVVLNAGARPLVGFDPYPFGLLTMIVSLEAIFLSTFVLISQNKMGEVADVRADLDLQVNLLSEYEITRMLRLVDAIAEKMGIEEALDPELTALKETTSAAEVMDEMAVRLEESKKS